jgi:glycosyltransferase involved in cell wall biosynthesis
MKSNIYYTLSVVIPVYNEERTISNILDKLKTLNIDNIRLELVIINDCSTDNSVAVINDYIASNTELMSSFFNTRRIKVKVPHCILA